MSEPIAPETDVEWLYLCDRRFHLRERTLTNRLYQLERQRIMELREGMVKVASLIAGSVALARVVEPTVITWAIAVIFAGTASSLVFGWGSKARDAAKRATEWIALDRDIEAAGERHFAEAQLNEWTARCNAVESSEPAANQRLLETCHRRACVALGCPPQPAIPWFHRWLMPIMIP